MFRRLEEINRRPVPFGHYTAADLWTDEHTSSQMLALPPERFDRRVFAKAGVHRPFGGLDRLSLRSRREQERR